MGIPQTLLIWSAACLRRKKRAPADVLDIVTLHPSVIRAHVGKILHDGREPTRNGEAKLARRYASNSALCSTTYRMAFLNVLSRKSGSAILHTRSMNSVPLCMRFGPERFFVRVNLVA
jgi:hypothetical protein